MSKEAIIYTDGSCLKNKNGGWSALIEDSNGKKSIISGGDINTTNNRMEVRAVIESVKQLEPGSKVTVISDSTYTVDGSNEWVHSWKKNDFKGRENSDLWKEIYELQKQYSLKLKWVRAHSVDTPVQNVLADLIAKEEATRRNSN